MIDVTWQLQALASIAVAVPLGVIARRGLERLDEQHEQKAQHEQMGREHPERRPVRS